MKPPTIRLEHHNGLLTLHFTLPLKTPVKAKTLQVEIYDEPISSTSAWPRARPLSPQRSRPMKVATAGPNAAATPNQAPNEAFFNSLDLSLPRARFANKIVVTCP